jgi:hypothetical protein
VIWQTLIRYSRGKVVRVSAHLIECDAFFLYYVSVSRNISRFKVTNASANEVSNDRDGKRERLTHLSNIDANKGIYVSSCLTDRQKHKLITSFEDVCHLLRRVRYWGFVGAKGGEEV